MSKNAFEKGCADDEGEAARSTPHNPAVQLLCCRCHYRYAASGFVRPLLSRMTLRTQKVSKRGEAEFKDIFASALKLVRVIQTLVELTRFFGPERSAQRKEHVRILKGARNGK